MWVCLWDNPLLFFIKSCVFMCEWGKLSHFAVCPLMSTAVSPSQTEADKRRHVHEAHAHTHIVFSPKSCSLSLIYAWEEKTNSERETERSGGKVGGNLCQNNSRYLVFCSVSVDERQALFLTGSLAGTLGYLLRWTASAFRCSVQLWCSVTLRS